MSFGQGTKKGRRDGSRICIFSFGRKAKALLICRTYTFISGRLFGVLLKYKWEPNSPTELVVRLPAHVAGIQQTSAQCRVGLCSAIAKPIGGRWGFPFCEVNCGAHRSISDTN